MAPSNAPRTGRGSFSSNGRHARRSHDADEDALFALSLDDVMDDRPWTADELTGGSVRATSPAGARDAAGRAAQQATRGAGTAARPASDPSETAAFLAAAAQRYVPGGSTSHAAGAPAQPAAPAPAATPMSAPAPAPAAGVSSETVAMPVQRQAAMAASAARSNQAARPVAPAPSAAAASSIADQPTTPVPMPSMSATEHRTAPAPAPRRPAPRPSAPTAASSSETVAMPAMAEAAAAQRPVAAPEVPDPSTLEPPVMDLDDLSHRQFAFDSWAATDLDETSAGMPALDGPVNPLYAGGDAEAASRHDDAGRSSRIETEDRRRLEDFYGSSEFAPERQSRIETEDYGTQDDGYANDPFAPAPEYAAVPAYADAAAAPAYAESTAEDDRFADYHREEEPPHFAQFSQSAKIAFIAVVVALLGLICFEGFQLFHGATQAESEVQKKEEADTEYLELNTLKGDPNGGGSSQ